MFGHERSRSSQEPRQPRHAQGESGEQRAGDEMQAKPFHSIEDWQGTSGTRQNSQFGRASYSLMKAGEETSSRAKQGDRRMIQRRWKPAPEAPKVSPSPGRAQKDRGARQRAELSWMISTRMPCSSGSIDAGGDGTLRLERQSPMRDDEASAGR